MKKAIVVNKNRISIDTNKLETNTLYYFFCLGEKWAIRKLPNGKLELRECEEVM